MPFSVIAYHISYFSWCYHPIWSLHNSYAILFQSNRYGIHLAQALTEKVIERGYSPFVVIRPENDASRNLYTKLGYRKAFETVRVTLQPTSKTNGCNGKLNGHTNGHHVDNDNKQNQANGDTNDDNSAAAAAQSIQNGNQNKVADANGINTSDELKQWSKSVRIVWFRFPSGWKKNEKNQKIQHEKKINCFIVH